MGLIPGVKPIKIDTEFKHEHYFSWFVHGIIYFIIIFAIVFFIVTQVLRVNIKIGF